MCIDDPHSHKTRVSMYLDQIPNGCLLRVKQVHHQQEFPDLAKQLEAIGFIPGEFVQVMRRSLIGGDPLVVRIGLSTFALRKKEAAIIEVEE